MISLLYLLYLVYNKGFKSELLRSKSVNHLSEAV